MSRLTYGMLKVGIRLKTSSTGLSMLEVILQPYKVWIWTPVFYSIKIVGSGNTLPSHTEIKVWNTLNIMDHTKVNITDTSHGVARQTSKSTCLDLKWNKRNCILTLSNALTAKEITK